MKNIQNVVVEHEIALFIYKPLIICQSISDYLIFKRYVRCSRNIKVILGDTCVKILLDIQGMVVESHKYAYASRQNHAVA